MLGNDRIVDQEVAAGKLTEKFAYRAVEKCLSLPRGTRQ